MDFDLTATQQAVADVATSVLDRDNSWRALVEGGVAALPVPERLGGDGVGLPEVATVLTEVGRHGAVTPALATLGLGVVPLLDLASDEQQDRTVAGVVAPDVVVQHGARGVQGVRLRLGHDRPLSAGSLVCTSADVPGRPESSARHPGSLDDHY